MLVRRTYLDHSHVASECSAAVKLLCLAEEYRDVVRISCLDALADIATHDACLVEEDAAEFRICVWGRSFGVEVVDAYILKFTCLASAAKRLDKNAWSAGNAAQMDVVS